MDKKKRTTPSPEQPKQEEVKTVLPEDALHESFVLDIEDLDPAVKGPVKAPVLVRSWWVYVSAAVLIIAAAAVIALIVIQLKKPALGDAPAIELAEEVEEIVPELPTENLSYKSVVLEQDQSLFYEGTQDECWGASIDSSEDEDVAPSGAPNLARPARVLEKLHFAPRLLVGEFGYKDQEEFNERLERTKRIVQTANRHSIKLTIHLGQYFLNLYPEDGTDVQDWVADGHEVGMYFDEVVQLGSTAVWGIPYGTWLTVVHDMQTEVEEVCDCEVTSLSGGASFTGIYNVVSELGMVAHSNWQDSDELTAREFLVVNPWTPAESGSVENMTMFNPNGPVVYIPNGVYPIHCEARDRFPYPVTDTQMSFLTQALYSSMEAATDGYVNVFSFTVRPEGFGETKEELETAYAAFDSWLRIIVGREARSRRFIFSTHSKVAEAYFDWIEENAGTIVPIFLGDESGEVREEEESPSSE